MQSKRKGDIIFIRLFPGEDINEELKKACKDHDVKTAVVLSGIGQLKNVKLGYFKKKGDYSPEEFEKPHELLSLTGNICNQDDEYVLHLHAVLGNEQKNAIGGHLISGFVEVTGEIVLLKTSISVKRELDEITGLKALSLE
ncbi:DNA-binding protein [Candidatus Babeliales bacterium]|nr:DNA-binding protein [Candidatus Babeliales bacterium]